MLLERDGELSVLEQLVGGAAASGGRVILLEAPAGIGKTRLLDEVRNRAGALGFRILASSGGELEHDFAFGVVRQLLEPAVTGAGSIHHEELWRALLASLSRCSPIRKRLAAAETIPPRRSCTGCFPWWQTSLIARLCWWPSMTCIGPTSRRYGLSGTWAGG